MIRADDYNPHGGNTELYFCYINNAQPGVADQQGAVDSGSTPAM